MSLRPTGSSVAGSLQVPIHAEGIKKRFLGHLVSLKQILTAPEMYNPCTPVSIYLLSLSQAYRQFYSR